MRCAVTGNPCGTDTWMVGRPCKCGPCQKYLAGRGASLREQDCLRRLNLGPVYKDEITPDEVRAMQRLVGRKKVRQSIGSWSGRTYWMLIGP